MPFACSICEEESTKICVQCTKDACQNHLCEKCRCCSDCCDCEVRMNAEPAAAPQPVAPQPNGQPATPEPHAETPSALISGTETLFAAGAPSEPAGIPAEDVAGQASDEDLPA